VTNGAVDGLTAASGSFVRIGSSKVTGGSSSSGGSSLACVLSYNDSYAALGGC
jgi:hypothetical protein